MKNTKPSKSIALLEPARPNLSRAQAVQAPMTLRHIARTKPAGAAGGGSAELFAGLLGASMLAMCGMNAAVAQDSKETELDAIQIESNSVRDSNPLAESDAPYKVNRSSSVKSARKIQETPKSITVVPKEAVEDSGASTLRDVMRTQPGITLGTGEGGSAYGDRFIIRGFEARNDIYVDGLRDPGVNTREIFAVEQLEISKGASSTFAGRGTTGGAINSVTKAPADEKFSKFSITGGAPSTQRLAVDLNRVLDNDVAFRVNAMVHREDVAGRDEVFDDRQGFAAALNWAPSDDLSVTVDYYHLSTNGMPDWGHPWDPSTNKPYQVDQGNFYGIKARDFWKTKSNIVTARVDYYITDNLRVNSQTRAGWTNNYYVVGKPSCFSPSVGDLCLANDEVISRTQSRDQDTRLLAHVSNFIYELKQGAIRHTIIGGFELASETFDNRRPLVQNTSGADPVLDLQNPNANAPWQGTITPGIESNSTQVDTQAIWVLDTVKLSEQWDVFGGLRWDNYSIESSLRDSDYDQNPQFNSVTTSFINGHAGAVRRFGSATRVYASVSTSSNPPGEQVDAGNAIYGGTSGSSGFKPERNRTVELGVKWEANDGRLALNTAVFSTEKEDAIVADLAGGTVSQVGGARVSGIELGASGRIGDLNILGGVTLLDTKITAAQSAASIGARLPNTAEQSAYLQLRYQLATGFAFGGTLTYKGDVYGGSLNAAANENRIPAWTRIDLMAEYKVNSRTVLRANVNNLADRKYYDALYQGANPFVYVAPGRSIALTLSYKLD